MARKARVWFPGANYHVTGRGIRQLDLFYDDKDRQKYLSILHETMQRYPFELNSYCLMKNHVHLLLKTFEVPPGPIIGYIHSNYAREFNKKYGFSGHVFEKRYYHDVIEDRGHHLTVSGYIHLNPLKAKIVKKLEDYKWSSYRAYFCNEENTLVTKNPILSYFSEPKQENYYRFIQGEYQRSLEEGGGR